METGIECRVSFVETPEKFFIQIGNETVRRNYQTLSQIVQDFCTRRLASFVDPHNTEIGEVVFLKYPLQDEPAKYTRGKVLQITSQSCVIELIDCGGVLNNVTSVLKVEASHKKFTEFPPAVKQCSLAFVEPITNEWADEAIRLFKKLCTRDMIYIPGEPENAVSLILRHGNRYMDVSEILVQARWAKRKKADDPLAADELSVYLNSLHSTQSLKSTSALTSQSDYEAQADECDQPHESRYNQRTERGSPSESLSIHMTLNLNHSESCGCLICFIRTATTEDHLTQSQQLVLILSKDWPGLTSEEESFLRHQITGVKLNSSEKEFLLDVFMALKERQTHRQADNLQSSSAKSPITNYTAQVGNSSSMEDGRHQNTYLSRQAKPPASNTGSFKFRDLRPDVERKVYNAVSARKSEEDGNFGDRNSYQNLGSMNSSYVSRGKPDAGESMSGGDSPVFQGNSMPSLSQTKGSSDFIGQNIESQGYDNSDNWLDLDNFLDSSDEEMEPGPSPIFDYHGGNAARSSSSGFSQHDKKNNSPRLLEMTEADGPASTNNRSPAFQGPQSKPSSAQSNKQLLNYGRGRSLVSSSHPKYIPPKSDVNQQQTSSTRSGGFGTVMYCTYCGSTTHRSSSCPEGTKNLFFN